MNKLIHSEDELKYFYDNVMPPLNTGEVYFMSLSARNKYLSTEEREELGLGRTEMFERTLVRERDWNKFLKKVRRFETPETAYLTKKDKPIPNKCIVVYFNINPSSSLKALSEFNKTISDYYLELAVGYNSEVFRKFNKIDVLLMNCYQRNRGRKSYIDIDFDIPKSEFDIVSFFLKDMSENNPSELRYFVIDTKSGFHVMIDRSTLGYNFNESIKRTMEFVDKKNIDNYEIINNKNEMVPLPGTYQAGFPVTIIKEVKDYVNRYD